MTESTQSAVATDIGDPDPASGFGELGVSPDLCASLADEGIETPFPIQDLTIPDALAGRDVCGKAKTGSGKTIAFGIPLVQLTAKAEKRRPRSLVLVPTRELAVQVSREIAPHARVRGLHIATVYGGVSMSDQIKALRKGVDILVATPGRLIDLIERREVTVEAVEILVLDEADQMSDMGFLPQVDRILRDIKGKAQTMLFSATLDGMVGNLVRLHLHDPVRHEVVSETVTVDEMEHRFLHVHRMDKVKVLARLARSAGRTLVFVRTKIGADKLVRDLKAQGINAAGLHGGKHQARREKTLKSFTDGQTPVLVATDVAARGLHVDGIDIVVHFDPPEDHKAYLHRSGRTARAGETGLAVTLVLWDQVYAVKRLQKQIGIDVPIIEVFSSDDRLDDVRSLDSREPEPEEKLSAGERRRAIRRRAMSRYR